MSGLSQLLEMYACLNCAVTQSWALALPVIFAALRQRK